MEQVHLLGGLKRKNIRQIISKWKNLTTIKNTDGVYNEVIKVVKHSQLPHNHFIYSMLLSIYENKRELKGLFTEANLIENFVEILLKKHCIYTSWQKPQFKTLLHFLGFLSKNMITWRKNQIDKNGVIKIALEFNKKTMHSYIVDDYINPLINSGIIKINDNLIEFSQLCFLNYAISYFMKHDQELKDFVLSEDNYLTLNKAVEYFASENPSTYELLNFIRKKVDDSKRHVAEIIKKEQDLNIYNLDFENMGNLSLLDIASASDEFEKKINEIKADRVRNDEMMDNIDPIDECDEFGGVYQDKHLSSKKIFMKNFSWIYLSILEYLEVQNY